MLTGDKRETALEIGLRCGLYDHKNMILFEVIESTDQNTLLNDLAEHSRTLDSANKNDSRFAMAVAGKSLPKIYQSPECCALIKKLFASCQSTIVYRSSPSQKAETVKYVKNNLATSCLRSLTTMAIGDGANDVNMI